jgi:hypothetical protein
MAVSDDGISDDNSVDTICGGGATVVAAVQSSTYFYLAAWTGRGMVLPPKFRNRMILQARDWERALEATDFLDRSWVVRRSFGFANGRRSVRYNEVEEDKVKPRVRGSFPKHN